MRAAFSRHGGVEVDTQGDAFFVAFERARDAVAAADDVQAALADGPGAGADRHPHGRAGRDRGGVRGRRRAPRRADHERGARRAGAHLGDDARLLDSTLELRDLGEHRLKDLSASQRLYQLGADDFPPLRTLYRTNLPIQPTPLVGRERELEEAGALLRSRRLLTLTGPGGSGKTRLALQLAADAVEQFPDGVFWVPLQALRDPALVERAIGSVGRRRQRPDRARRRTSDCSSSSTISNRSSKPRLSSRRCSPGHRTRRCSSRAESRCTSSRNSGIRSSRCPRTTPRSFSSSALGRSRPDSARQRPSVRSAAGSTASHSRSSSRRHASRCSIRTSSWRASNSACRSSPPAHATRPRGRERCVRRSSGATSCSHRTSRSCSVSLAVFRGSFTLEAAEAVCAADLDTLESLVVKNLVRRWESGRLGMLDTIREYARRAARRSPEADETSSTTRRVLPRRRRRHQPERRDTASRRPQRFDMAIAEQRQLPRRARVDVAEQVDRHSGSRSRPRSSSSGRSTTRTKAIRWFERLFEAAEGTEVPPDLRAEAVRALRELARTSPASGRPPRTSSSSSLAIFESSATSTAALCSCIAWGSRRCGAASSREARKLVEASDEIHRRSGRRLGPRPDDRIARCDRPRRRRRTSAFELDPRERRARARDRRSVVGERDARRARGPLCSTQARSTRRETRARESLELADRLRDRSGRIFGVGLLARVAAERGQSERAGRLWGAIEDEERTHRSAAGRRHRETCEARIRGAAGPDFERGCAEGRALTLDDAVTLAV